MTLVEALIGLISILYGCYQPIFNELVNKRALKRHFVDTEPGIADIRRVLGAPDRAGGAQREQNSSAGLQPADLHVKWVSCAPGELNKLL